MPLLLLAAAKQAVTAIQQGCELYKEYKGTILEAKKTFNEVQGIAKEVGGVWDFIKNKLFGTKKPVIPIAPPPVQPSKQKDAPVQYDELTITLNIIAQLKVFFSCLTQLKQKVADAQLHSLDAKTEDELLNSSVDIEYAITEVEKLQRTIRETMVYQIGGDLGDLYTKVVKRVGIIQEQQEVARLAALKKRKEELWLQNQRATKRNKRVAIALIALLVTVETWALFITIHMTLHT